MHAEAETYFLQSLMFLDANISTQRNKGRRIAIQPLKFVSHVAQHPLA